MKTKKEENSKKRTLRNIISIVFFIIFIVLVVYLVYYFYSKSKNKEVIEEVQQEVSKIEEESNKITELKQINNDIIGWIEIENTKINYPILQTDNNDFYLTHDYKKEKNKYGSIYLKDGCNIDDVNSNLIIYGHNMKDEEMFNTLLNYKNKKYYDENKIVKIETENEKREYEIIAAFKSRVFYKDEKNVFRYYNYLKFNSESEYNTYLKNIKKIQLYDTGVTSNYGEQLLTMITCEYSQENGRMVVVAKRIK